MVVFSSVSIATLKKCGVISTYVSADKLSYTTERLMNIIEWDYYSPSLSFTPDNNYYDHKIFVNCSDLSGMEVYQAYSGSTNVKLNNSELLNELRYALLQLKKYLLSLYDEGPDGGKIKLSICAIHPVECLLFAFQKMLGCSIENESLYLDFFEIYKKDTTLAFAKDWLNTAQQKWEYEIEYCSVHQIFFEQATRWTPLGLREKRMQEMEKLRDTLEPVEKKLISAYNNWVSESGKTFDYDKATRLNEEYEAEIKKWEKKGYILRPKWDSNVNPASGGAWTYHVPHLEFEGRECSYQMLNDMIKAQKDEDHNAVMEAAKPENAEKRKKEIDKTVNEKKKEKNLKLKELDDRDKAIDGKIAELKKRNTDNSMESNLWNYSSKHLYNTAEEQRENKKLIEFEGDLLDENQLRAKKAENAEEKQRISKEFWDLNDKMQTEKQDIDNLVQAVREAQEKEDLDRTLSWCQFGLAIAGMALLVVVAAPVAAPVAAICAGLAGVTTAAGIGIEVYKWVEIDEGENVGKHLFSIGLDLISFKCIPIFKILGRGAVKEAKAAVSIQQKILTSEIETAASRSVAADRKVLSEWITTMNNGDNAALSFVKNVNTKGVFKTVDPEDLKELNKLISNAKKKAKKQPRVKRSQRVKRADQAKQKMQAMADDQEKMMERAKYLDPKSGRLSYLNDQAAMLEKLGNDSLLTTFGNGMNPVQWFKPAEGFKKTSSVSEGFAKFLGCDKELAKIESALGKTRAVDSAGFYRTSTYLLYGGFDVLHYKVSIVDAGGVLFNRDDYSNPNLSK